ncbi:MAG: tyrosine-type recombinase/integrase [Paenibacillus sp.]|nr:tyrosine-type recombinase/integrase [Paenibacillus sp.]
MAFEYQVDITPEQICDLYDIDIHDFLNLVEGKKIADQDEKTILFVIEDYIHSLERNESKSKLTINLYITILRAFGRFIMNKDSGCLMSGLTEGLFIDFVQSCKPRKSKSLTARTYNTYRAIIRKLMEFALTKDYLSKDLRHTIEVKRGEILPHYLPDELVPLVLKEAKKTNWPFLNFALIYFMLGTGCRVSEVASMRICDFRINEDIIFVRAGKGQKERFVPMYPEVKIVILDFLKRTGVYEWDLRNQSPLFSKRCLENREFLKINNIQYMITKIYEKLNVKGLYTVHSLRHTFAYNSLKVGMAIHDIQEVLGHSNIETTRIYTKRRPADLKDSVNRYPFPLEKLVAHIVGIGG